MDNFINDSKAWEDFRAELLRDRRSAMLLAEESSRYLKISRISVADNPKGKHGAALNDYVSQAPYWWPDPQKPGGLPYIRRDGIVNPKFHESDRGRIELMCDAVSCLTLQAFASGLEIHAAHAGRLLKCWFSDPATRMNPHLRHAQFIPGICEGRGIGLIDTAILCNLLDMVARLPFSKDWTEADLAGLKKWMEAYLQWFLESDFGRKETGERNNHGTWYDAQAVCFAMFCGREETARRQIKENSFQRIRTQIEADGRQPHELARTLSMSYCTFNLAGFATLAQLARRLGIDLWNWKTPDGRGILPAIRWMLPYYLGEKDWGFTQLGEFSRPSAAYLLSLAAQGTDDAEFADAAARLAEHPWNKISSRVFPRLRT